MSQNRDIKLSELHIIKPRSPVWVDLVLMTLKEDVNKVCCTCCHGYSLKVCHLSFLLLFRPLCVLTSSCITSHFLSLFVFLCCDCRPRPDSFHLLPSLWIEVCMFLL